jgi:hypothetical protein
MRAHMGKCKEVGMRRKAGIGFAAAALAAVMMFGPAFVGSQTTAGEESSYLDTATQWFSGGKL